MRIRITADGCHLTEEMRDSVVREIKRLAQSVDRPINIVAVHLVDEHGRAVHGLDCRCDVRVEFDDDRALSRSDAEASFRESICEAFARLLYE